MKKILLVVLTVSFALFSGSMLAKEHGKGNASSEDKIIIEHKGRDIVISVSAWPAHCKHGDEIREAEDTALENWDPQGDCDQVVSDETPAPPDS